MPDSRILSFRGGQAYYRERDGEIMFLSFRRVNEYGDRILMTKYADREYKKYALIAGFTESGETAEQKKREHSQRS